MREVERSKIATRILDGFLFIVNQKMRFDDDRSYIAEGFSG